MFRDKCFDCFVKARFLKKKKKKRGIFPQRAGPPPPVSGKKIYIKTLEIAQFSENFEEKIIICHILKIMTIRNWGHKIELSAWKFDLTPPKKIKNLSLQFCRRIRPFWSSLHLLDNITVHIFFFSKHLHNICSKPSDQHSSHDQSL